MNVTIEGLSDDLHPEYIARVMFREFGRRVRITSLETQPINEELGATIKKQNQILLIISAELEAIKQCDPFDSVFIAYSVENISNMIEDLKKFTEWTLSNGGEMQHD